MAINKHELKLWKLRCPAGYLPFANDGDISRLSVFRNVEIEGCTVPFGHCHSDPRTTLRSRAGRRRFYR
jgi:hypothetical protein